MALSRSIHHLLEFAEEISAVDDGALDALGRRLLEAVVNDPDVSEQIRERAARVLRASEGTSSSSAPHSDGAPD